MSIFDNVVFPKAKRSTFDLSHERTQSLEFGKLTPFLCEDVLPGDIWSCSVDNLIRAMPMSAPLMDKVDISFHYFFVPYRLVWEDWEDFITGGEDGTAQPILPFSIGDLIGNELSTGSLSDYLGLQFPVENQAVRFNCLAHRAYYTIWNEWYRDVNLQEEVSVNKASGYDETTAQELVGGMGHLMNRNYRKDYFTSALPWTQRGPQASVAPNLTDSVNIIGRKGVAKIKRADSNTDEWINATELATFKEEVDGSDAQYLKALRPDSVTYTEARLDPNGTLIIDNEEFQNNVNIDINNLRRAIALQRFLETNARAGSRPQDQLLARWGVYASDVRLQRPQFLGGSTQPLTISEVLQTSQTTADSDLGDMAGHGISASRSKRVRFYAKEHGIIMGLCSVMPRASYSQGCRRFFGKNDKFDFAMPEFANLGEQPVFNSEIWAGGITSLNDESGVFGYQSRYAEYKFIPNTVHGAMRTESFVPWTLTRKFENLPTLSGEFIDVDNDEENLGRIFPVNDEPTQFILMLRNNIKAVRKLPKHVIPTL